MDAVCQAAATSAGLGGSWQAWAGASTGTPSTRFVHGTVPYVLVGGGQIAASWDDLTDGTLAAPIDHDEHGNALTSALPDVWTGVSADGTTVGGTCSDWTMTATNAWHGSPLATDMTWTFDGGGPCSGGPRRLYCFER